MGQIDSAPFFLNQESYRTKKAFELRKPKTGWLEFFRALIPFQLHK